MEDEYTLGSLASVCGRRAVYEGLTQNKHSHCAEMHLSDVF